MEKGLAHPFFRFSFLRKTSVSTEGLHNCPHLVIILGKVSPVEGRVVGCAQHTAVSERGSADEAHHLCDAAVNLVDIVAQTELGMALLVLAVDGDSLCHFGLMCGVIQDACYLKWRASVSIFQPVKSNGKSLSHLYSVFFEFWFTSSAAPAPHPASSGSSRYRSHKAGRRTRRHSPHRRNSGLVTLR
jgi:hypothetical protein